MSVAEVEQAPSAKRRKLRRPFGLSKCCWAESTKLLSTTFNILTESLATNPQGWKTIILQFTKGLKSLEYDQARPAVYALTQLWSGKSNAKNGGKWNPGFSSMVGLPDDIYQVHLEALRDALQFNLWREYTYEDSFNRTDDDDDKEEGEEEAEEELIIQEAYLIASIRDDFEQIIPQHLLPLLKEIQSLASTIMSQAGDNISKNDDPASWALMKVVCERNWELVKPYVPQLCRATCSKRGYNLAKDALFWVTLCKTAKNSQCCQEAMTEIALAASQLSAYDGDKDNMTRILTVGIECGIWTRGSFARFIETSFTSLSYPWAPALTRFLHILLRSYGIHGNDAPAEISAILSLLKQTMRGITGSSPPESGETAVLLLCAYHFPSALFCTTANVSRFLTLARYPSVAFLALNHIFEKPNEGDWSLSDVESLVTEAINKPNWDGYDHVRFLSYLLGYPAKLTIKNAEGMLTILSQNSTHPNSNNLLNSTIQLLIQCVRQVGLTPSILQTALGVARQRMGSQWESSSLAALQLGDGNVHQAKRVCRRFKRSLITNFTFTIPTPPRPNRIPNVNANTSDNSIESFEKLCCQLMNVALTFSQTLFQVTRETLTETPAALVVEYLDLICD